MGRVLAAEASRDAFDADFSADSRGPYDVARELATPEAVPYLVDVLERGLPGRTWAVHALGLLGERGRDAAPVLEKLGEWVTLFKVNEGRAREIGVHLRKDPSTGTPATSVRGAVAELVSARGAWEARAHFAELLGSDDVERLMFALDANGRDSSRLRRLAESEPASVPVAEVRMLLSHGSDEVVAAAARVLCDLHLPVDAQRVLDAVQGRGILVDCAEWAAPLRDSMCLIEGASSLALYELVRRRRCAGLSVDVELVRAKVRALLEPVAPVKSINARAIREMDLANASQIALELHDVELVDALVDVIGPCEVGYEARFEDLVPTFAALANAADAALARGRERFTGERAERVGWMIDSIAKVRARVPGSTLALADKYFADGVLEDSILNKSAYSAYAQVLAREPTNAHAAYQLAWIDRGFGTPMTPERIAWLRQLRVKDTLLDALARKPASILHGPRSTHRSVREPNPTRALQAEQAGLFPIAALYHDAKSREAARCVEQTRAHLANVRGGVG